MKYLIWIILCSLTLLQAQSSLPEKTDNTLLNRLLLNNMLDAAIQDEVVDDVSTGGPRKSVGKAVLMSAVLPGAGQLYAGSYLKSALFLAIEATAWAVNISYNKKGDDQTDLFHGYADQYWSEQRYWTHVYMKLNDVSEIPGFPYGAYDGMVEDDFGRLVIPNWQEAEQALSTFAITRYISDFSHELPATKTQQYYEMIGKYPEQFGNAWADASYGVHYVAPYGGVKVSNITGRNIEYVDMRDEANQLYDRAGYGTMIALVNHVISAIDAGFTARRFNNRQVRLTYINRLFYDRYENLFGLSMTF